MTIAERPTATEVDPITFEIVRSAFVAIANEMALVVAKSAYSTPVNEGRDLAATVYDRHGRLVAQAEFATPAFAGVTQLTVPVVIEGIGADRMSPGDVYIVNDPYVASTHCNDVHLVKPLFVEGELAGFVATTAHWSDVGGVVPGSLNCRAATCYEEGVRIPPVTVVREGEIDLDIVRILLANMRESWERMGDLNAQIAALAAGEQRLAALVDRVGPAVVEACMAGVQDHSERLIRAALSSLPDGRYVAEDLVDLDLATGEPTTVRMALEIDGDRMVVDLTGSDPAAASGINCTIAATTSAIFIGIASILPPIPINAGLLRAVEIRAVEGSLVWARPPSAVSGLAATTMECIIGCTMHCLSLAHPERGVASPYAILNAVFSGYDDRVGYGNTFINYSWGFGGLGATRHRDGASVVGSAYGGSTQNIPCELQERRYPVVYWRYGFLPDSGGPGRTRGGLAHDQLLSFAYSPGTVSCIGNRERFGPPGVFDGQPGRRARLVLNPDSPEVRNVGIFCVNEPAARGDRMSLWSAGGGGYGDPLERPVAAVVEDLLDGLVTESAAADDYGVVLRELDLRRLTCMVDEEATADLRRRMAGPGPTGHRPASNRPAGG